MLGHLRCLYLFVCLCIKSQSLGFLQNFNCCICNLLTERRFGPLNCVTFVRAYSALITLDTVENIDDVNDIDPCNVLELTGRVFLVRDKSSFI